VNSPADSKSKPSPRAAKTAPTFENRVQPKKPRAAYIYFCSEMQAQVREQNPELKAPEVISMIGSLWNKLSEAKRKPFHNKAQLDAVRYEKEFKQVEQHGYFINERGENSKDLQPKHKFKLVESEVVPTKARTAFIYFISSIHSKIAAQHPEKAMTELSRIKADIWNGLSEKQREPYKKMQQNDALRYQDERRQLEEQGYFVNQDGVKSTDLKGRVKRSRSPIKEAPGASKKQKKN
jgi:hypothetical protein